MNNSPASRIVAELLGEGRQKSDQTLHNDAVFVLKQLRDFDMDGDVSTRAELLDLFNDPKGALPGFDNLFSVMEPADQEKVADNVLELIAADNNVDQASDEDGD